MTAERSYLPTLIALHAAHNATPRRTIRLPEADVEFRLDIEVDHIQVEGNLCATDDPAQDAADTAEVLARLQAGDECAWCTLVVVATAYDGTTGHASLGGVSMAADHPWGPALTDYVRVQYPELWTEALEALQLAIETNAVGSDPKALALALHLDVLPSTIDVDTRGDRFECSSEPGEWMVLTDAEADTAWEESLDSYIDECILPERDGTLAAYFDRDAWKRDARHDGRGHSLSSYDGEEHEIKLDGEWYFIYRVG